MQEENNHKEIMHEELCDRLLTETYKTATINIYDLAAHLFTEEENKTADIKHLADQLAKEKLADYVDKEHTLLSITNFGRYWMVKGGYLTFLKDSHVSKEHSPEKQHAKEELLEARLRLTHFRLIGFWLTIIISVIGFALSVFNLYMLLRR
jgi:hypothetical protein